jgi:hypothetical protein
MVERSKAPSVAFSKLNTEMEKKLLRVASLEIADRGGVTDVLWGVLRLR